MADEWGILKWAENHSTFLKFSKRLAQAQNPVRIYLFKINNGNTKTMCKTVQSSQ